MCGKIDRIDAVLYWNRNDHWNDGGRQCNYYHCGGCLLIVRLSYVLQIKGMRVKLHTFLNKNAQKNTPA